MPCSDNLEVQLSVNGFRPLAVSVEHALRAGILPPYHDDPFDRLLVAQAQAQSRPDKPRSGYAKAIEWAF
jgi:PIN domain nuclease of toxin-antitoxin system